MPVKYLLSVHRIHARSVFEGAYQRDNLDMCP